MKPKTHSKNEPLESAGVRRENWGGSGRLSTWVAAGAIILALATSGCQVLSYRGANGERFTRTTFGVSTAIASLGIETGTNGIRRVDLQGYRNDSTQTVQAVTEAAIRAALQGAR